MAELELETALEALLGGIDAEQGRKRVLYWERALQAVDPMDIENPVPWDSEYRPEAEYFSRLEAAGRLDLASATLVFEVMFSPALIRDSVRDALASIVGDQTR